VSLLTLPAIGRPELIEYDVSFPAQRNRSPFSGRAKIIGLPGCDLWSFRMRWTPLATETQVRAWRAAMMGLRGMRNHCAILPLKSLYMSPTAVQKNGLAASYTVASVPAMNEINLNSAAGLEVGLFGSVAAGGHIRLFVITAIAGVKITISPELNQPPAAATVVEFKRPVSHVRLTNPNVRFSDEDGKVGFVMDWEENL